jgi:hypothetical protein
VHYAQEIPVTQMHFLILCKRSPDYQRPYKAKMGERLRFCYAERMNHPLKGMIRDVVYLLILLTIFAAGAIFLMVPENSFWMALACWALGAFLVGWFLHDRHHKKMRASAANIIEMKKFTGKKKAA